MLGCGKAKVGIKKRENKGGQKVEKALTPQPQFIIDQHLFFLRQLPLGPSNSYSLQ